MKRRYCSIHNAVGVTRNVFLQLLRLLGIVLGFCVTHRFPLGISIAPSLCKVSRRDSSTQFLIRRFNAERQLLLSRAPVLEDLKYEQEDECTSPMNLTGHITVTFSANTTIKLLSQFSVLFSPNPIFFPSQVQFVRRFAEEISAGTG